MMVDEAEIVIVEDNIYDAELILRVFDEHHISNKCIVLKDGVEAVEYFFGKDGLPQCGIRSECPKLVLLDLKLPKVNGVDVLRRLKSDERTKKIPVVILTSSNEERDIKAAYDLGVNSYVTKPIKFEELAKVVADLGLYWLVVNKTSR